MIVPTIRVDVGSFNNMFSFNIFTGSRFTHVEKGNVGATVTGFLY